jgi:hypothetical protein
VPQGAQYEPKPHKIQVPFLPDAGLDAEPMQNGLKKNSNSSLELLFWNPHVR